jgi:membrane protein
MNEFFLHWQNIFLQTSSNLSAHARRFSAFALLLDAWQAYRRDEMGMLSAALAYYLLLALFPLLLLLIAIATPFLTSEQVVGETVRFATNYFPGAGAELRRILQQVVSARGPVTVFAAAGLLWSASGVFDLVQRGLNRAWRVSQPRPLWRQRLVSLATVIGLGLLFGISFATSAFMRSGLRLRFQVAGISIEIVSLVLTTLLNFVLFAIIYKGFPFAVVTYRQVWGSALLASILWELAKILFVFYLLNFARLSLVYGSVGAVIALLLWGYITAAILLFGAEMSAVQTLKEMK